MFHLPQPLVAEVTQAHRQALDLPIVWKTEGLPDLIGLKSCMLAAAKLHPHSHQCWTNKHGAGENPLSIDARGQDKSWLLQQHRGRIVYVVHDLDHPGQAGALEVTSGDGRRRPGWAPVLAQFAAETRNIVLPGEIRETKGPDLEDFLGWLLAQYLARGDSIDQARAYCYLWLLDYAQSQPIIAPWPVADGTSTADTIDTADSTESEPIALHQPADHRSDCSEFPLNEEKDDPHRLARLNLDRYRTEFGKDLKYWREGFYAWKRGRYESITRDYLKSRIVSSIKTEFDRIYEEERQAYEDWKASDRYDADRDKGPPKVRKVTRSLIQNVMEATQSLCCVSDSVEMPCWLETRRYHHYVAMRNGILNLEKLIAADPATVDPQQLAEEMLESHSPQWFSTFCLDYDFLPNAYPARWLDYLHAVMEGDMERIRLLQEWAGYCLTSRNDLQKFLCLEGDGGNGKTVFFAGIEAMLGSDNVSHVPIENFGGRFDLGSTLGKAANIAGDVGELDSVAEGLLKQFTGGDWMHFDRKGIQPITARPTAKLMCAWNNRPRFKDRSSGLWRRMILVPFNYRVPEDQRVLGMDEVGWWIEQGEVPGILMWAIAGLKRLKTHRRFTQSRVCAEALDNYRTESNPAAEFLVDHLETSDSEVEMVFSHQIFEAYEHWCRKLGIHPLGSRHFFRELRKIYPFAKHTRASRVHPGRPWGYTGIKFSDDEIFGKKISSGEEWQ